MTGSALTTYDEQWAKEARAAAAVEPLVSGTWLSAKGGVLSIGEETMPGNQAAVIIIDSYAENTYYGAKWDQDNPQPPVCYALGRDAQPMFPDIPNMSKDMSYFMPQHMVNGEVLGCDKCPMNEWGSAAEGRGKACQNRRRLAMVPAGYYTPKRGSRDFDLHLFDDVSHFQTAEAAFMKLSVTSVKGWAKYVHDLDATHHRPPHGMLTRLYVEPHPKFQYEIKFEPIQLVPDALFDVIMTRRRSQVDQPMQGYTAPDPNREPKQQRGGFRR